MKLIITLSLFALACYGQPRIIIRVTDAAGVEHVAKITGTPAAAGLDSLTQWMATQQTCTTGEKPVCTPKYANPSELVKSNLISVLESIVERFPSAQTKAVVDDIETRKAALVAARKALFDAAKAEK